MKKQDNYGDEFWEDLYKVDAREEYENGAYTEDGDQVYCVCGEEMTFVPESNWWQCRNCGNFKTRTQWFDHIDANPPGPKCLAQCRENYPVCKNWCIWYDIPDDDPIL